MTLEELNALEPSRAEAECRRVLRVGALGGGDGGGTAVRDVDAMIAHG